MHRHETYQRRVKYSACLRNDAYFEADRSCKGSRAWCLIIVKHVPNMKKWRVTTRVAYGHNMPHDNTWHGFHSMFHQSWYCIADRLVVQKENDLDRCLTDPTTDQQSSGTNESTFEIDIWWYLMIFEGFLKWGYPQFSSIFVGFLWIFHEINHPASLGYPMVPPFQMTLPISASFRRYSEVLCTVCASW